jgi:hypothetical protein
MNTKNIITNRALSPREYVIDELGLWRVTNCEPRGSKRYSYRYTLERVASRMELRRLSDTEILGDLTYNHNDY